jgi:hypothetical protein
MRRRARTADAPVVSAGVSLPADLFAFSLACDLFVLVDGPNPIGSTLAIYTLAAGIVGGLLAAAFELKHVLSVRRCPTGRFGIGYVAMSLVALAVFATSFALRLGGQGAARAAAVSLCAMLLLVGCEWLGRYIVDVARIDSSSGRALLRRLQHRRNP